MPAAPWANSAQLDFLNDRRLQFAGAQRSKKLPEFWTTTNRDFFAIWPDASSEVDLSASSDRKPKPKPSADMDHSSWVKLRQSNIYNWFNNHALNKGRRAGKINTVKISVPASASRVSSELHLYSKKYYATRVKMAVDAEIGDQDIERKQRLAIVNKHLKEAYENETAEVKAEIRSAIQEEQNAKRAAKETDRAIVEAHDILTPEQLLTAQSSLHDVISDFCETMGERTGWSFMVLAGGPDPSANGDISTIGIHTGRDSFGQSFRKAFKTYEDGILTPFSTFLHSVYPESIRQKYIVAKTDLDEDAKTSSSATGTIKDEVNKDTDSSQDSVGRVAIVVQAADSSPVASSTPAQRVETTPAIAIATVPASLLPTQLVAAPTPPSSTAAAPVSALPVQLAVTPTPTPPVKSQNPQASVYPGLVAPATSFVSATPPTLSGQTLPLPNAPSLEPKPGLSLQSSTVHNQVGLGWNYPNIWTGNDNNFAAYPQMNSSGEFPQGNNFDLFDFSSLDMLNAGRLDGESVEYDDMDQFVRDLKAQELEDLHIFGQSLLPTNEPFLSQPNVSIPLSVQLAVNAPPTAQVDAHLTSQVAASNEPLLSQRDLSISTLDQLPVKVPPTAQASNLALVSQQAVVSPPAQPAIEADQALSSIAPPFHPTVSAPEQPAVNQARSLQADEDAVNDAGRQRQRKPVTSKEVVPLTDKATSDTKPQWLTTASNYLKEGLDDSILWRECLEAWMKFEVEVGLIEGTAHRLGAKSRPAELSKWLQNRKYEAMPVISNMPNFSVEWMSWWNNVQPKWRVNGAPHSLPLPLDTAQDMTPLRKGGPNGLVTAIIGLRWWASLRESDGLWLEAVGDMKGCLEAMLISGKRKAAAAVEGGKPKKRKIDRKRW